jgi:predicted amidophosphoribosyltransferase
VALLVDDVLTSGATADACARTLLAGGATRVHVWALARAGIRNSP